MKIRCSYSKKQLITIRDFAKEKFVIHSGPFGCGKTQSCVTSFGKYCADMQLLRNRCSFALVGRTVGAVKRNMCNVMSSQFGSDFRYFNGNGDGFERDAILFGQSLYLIGMNDKTSREKIQGISNLFGCLWDECTLATEEMFNYIIGRLRGEVNVVGDNEKEEDGAEYIEVDDDLGININEMVLPEGTVPMWFVGCCNPDSPNHFIKKAIDSGLVKNVKWYMSDAIWKGAKEYYEKLARQYLNNKAFYNRYLKGIWQAADRMVFSMWIEKVHKIDATSAEVNYSQVKNYLGVDYGSDHPTAVVLVSLDALGNFIVSREWGLRNTAPSSIVQLLAEIVDWLRSEKAIVKNIFVDPSAVAIKDEMTKSGMAYTNANNEHVAGIGKLQTLLSLNKLYVFSTCVSLIGQIYSYHYKDTMNGKDEVVKLDDDFVDAMRYAVYTASIIG